MAAPLVPLVIAGLRYLVPKVAKSGIKNIIKNQGKAAGAKAAKAASRTGKIAKTVAGKTTKGRRSGVAVRNKKGQLSGVSKKDQAIASNIRTGGTVAAGTGAAVAAGMAGDRKKNTAAAKPPAKAAKSKFGVGNSKVITQNGKPMANVSREQLDATGLSLRAYMNSWNNTGKRPTKNTKKKSAAT